jgi:hypothetical protein
MVEMTVRPGLRRRMAQTFIRWKKRRLVRLLRQDRVPDIGPAARRPCGNLAGGEREPDEFGALVAGYEGRLRIDEKTRSDACRLVAA